MEDLKGPPEQPGDGENGGDHHAVVPEKGAERVEGGEESGTSNKIEGNDEVGRQGSVEDGGPADVDGNKSECAPHKPWVQQVMAGDGCDHKEGYRQKDDPLHIQTVGVVGGRWKQ